MYCTKYHFKKKGYFENKLGICKPKDLWKAIKSLGLPNKSGGCIVCALAKKSNSGI